MNNTTTNYKYSQLTAKLICVDPEYQRGVDINRVKRIVANFNQDLVNPIKVNLRDDKWYCFDGQHTLCALVTKFGNDVMVECKAYEGQTKEWEAKMFSEQNGIQRFVESIYKLRALYTAGDIDVIEFHRATNSTGVRMDFTKGVGVNKICAVSTAYKLFRTSNVSDYIEILKIIKETYPNDINAFSRQIITAIGEFHKLYKGEYSRTALISRLQKNVDPVQIIRDVKMYANEGSSRYANIILQYYNKNTSKNRLERKI